MFYCEFYETQEALLERIDELKEEEFYEEDFHLYAQDDTEDLKWLKYTHIHFHPYYADKPEGGFRSIFSTEEPANRYLYKTGLEDDTIDEYLERLSNGEYLLTYSDHYKKRRTNDRLGKDTSSESQIELKHNDAEYDYK